jgi:hypothetical protein
MRLNLPGKYNTLHEYVQDLITKFDQKDPTLTKLQIDDFHYPHGLEGGGGGGHGGCGGNGDDDDDDDEEEEYFDPATICKLLRHAKGSPHVKELELRFLEIDSTVAAAVLELFTETTQNEAHRKWESVSVIGCSTVPQGRMRPPLESNTVGTLGGSTTTNNNNHSHNNASSSSSSSLVSRSTSQTTVGVSSELFIAFTLSGMDHCKRLILNHNNIQYAGFCSLGMLLRFNSTLQTLHLKRDVLSGENARALLEGLQNNVTLKELVLNFCRFDDEGIQALSDCLSIHKKNQKKTTISAFASFPPLELLDMGACYMSDSHVAQVVSSLVGHPTLTALVLTLNSCHAQGTAAMARLLQHSSCKLQALTLSHQKDAEHSGGTRMDGSLPNGIPRQQRRRQQQQPQSPGLGNATNNNNNNNNNIYYNINQVQVPVLARALKTNQSLQRLTLSRNRLETEDIQELWNVLATDNCTLKVLDLNNNALSTLSLSTLANVLPRFRGLQKLLLLNNEILGSEIDTTTIQALRRGLEINTSIQSIELRASVLDQVLPEWSYYCALNQAGRYLLHCPQEKVPLALWPLVLARVSRSGSQLQHQHYGFQCKSSSNNNNNASIRMETIIPHIGTTVLPPAPPQQHRLSDVSTSVLFHLLQQGPLLYSTC